MKLISLALNATTLQMHDPWLSLEMAQAAGLTAVEGTAGNHPQAMIHPYDERSATLAALERFEALGLCVSALGAHRDLSDPSQLEQFLALLERASELRCPVITTGVPDGCSQELFCQGLYQAATLAQRLGVAICLENHGYEHGSGQSLLALCKIHPGLRLCYDTGNAVYYGGVSPLEDLPLCLNQVRHLHIKDQVGGKGVWNFPPAGSGEVPLDTLLETTDWPQPISASLEIEFTPQGVTLGQTRTAVAQAVAYIRNLPHIAEMK